MPLRRFSRLIVYFAVLTACLQSTFSFACPDDQYEQCVLGACVCLPKVGGAVGNAVGKHNCVNDDQIKCDERAPLKDVEQDQDTYRVNLCYNDPRPSWCR
jgi:hypothetical protein